MWSFLKKEFIEKELKTPMSMHIFFQGSIRSHRLRNRNPGFLPKFYHTFEICLNAKDHKMIKLLFGKSSE